MGVQVSLEAWHLAPKRVRALVMMCGSYGKVTATFHGSDVLKQVLPTVIRVVEENQGLARALWGRIPAGVAFKLATMMREVDGVSIREEDFRWYVEHVAAMEPSLFLSMLKLAGEHTAEDYLARIDVPSLVIAAERDTFTPSALAAHLAETIPGGELFMLRGASHAAPIEQPEAIALRFDEFEMVRLGGLPSQTSPGGLESPSRSRRAG
jgi:pimeloyl-ACP methyl ester carboxylesterase